MVDLVEKRRQLLQELMEQPGRRVLAPLPHPPPVPYAGTLPEQSSVAAALGRGTEDRAKEALPDDCYRDDCFPDDCLRH